VQKYDYILNNKYVHIRKGECIFRAIVQ